MFPSRRSSGTFGPEGSKASVDDLTRPWFSRSGTEAEPVLIDDDEDDEGEVDVFGAVHAPESSRAPAARTSTKIRPNFKAKGKKGKQAPSGGRPSLLIVRNDIPLFDPVVSDTDQDLPSPASRSADRRRVQHVASVDVPYVPQNVLDLYTYRNPTRSPEPSPRPLQVRLPPTPPTTVAGQLTGRVISSPSASEADFELRDMPYGNSSPTYADVPLPMDEDEELPIDEDEVLPRDEDEVLPEDEDEEMGMAYEHPPSPPQSPRRAAPMRFRDVSSVDPLAEDWETPGSQMEIQDGDDGQEEDEEDGDEGSYEEEENQPTPRVKKSLRSYSERVEASKAALQHRLRLVAPTSHSKASSHSPVPSAISVSSGSGSAMPLSKRPPKRKMAARKPSAVGSVQSDSAYDAVEGEDEIEEIGSSDFDNTWTAKKKGKAKGGKKGKKRNSRAVSEVSSVADDDILGWHRGFCEKCKQGPADGLLAAALKKKRAGKGAKRRKARDDDDDQVSEAEAAEDMQGWLDCEGCVTSWHWGCLGHQQQQDALQYLERKEGPPAPDKKKRKDVKIDESVMFECRKCIKTPDCMVCHRAVHVPEPEEEDAVLANGDDVGGADGEVTMVDPIPEEPPSVVSPADKPPEATVDGAEGEKQEGAEDGEEEPAPRHIQFRCLRCTQSAHYECLPDQISPPDGEEFSLGTIAEWYQKPTSAKNDQWTCHQCRNWIWKVDMIIAWRPLPAGAVEEDRDSYPVWNADLPREYLVKFVDRGIRHTTWVTHSWLKVMSAGRLRNFLEKGPSLDLVTDETLAAKGDDMNSPTIAMVMSQHAPEDEILGEVRPHHHASQLENGAAEEWRGKGPPPEVNAKTNLPIAWSTIDRVLDIYMTPPPPRKKNRSKRRISSESVIGVEYDGPDGVFPLQENMVSIEDWERLAGRQLVEEDAEEIAGVVSWLFAKWDDLQYEQSAWDTPPPRDSELYPAYLRALKRYLGARNVVIPILTPAECKRRDAVRLQDKEPPSSQPECVVGGTLMNFQMEGLQWLMTKYYKRESAILADDMGLGKTVQIAALLGTLGAEKIYPFLVVVPNSTITNWVREFEKWVPHMRVVPFYGEAGSRKIIREYELYGKGKQGDPEGLKAHIVLTTYDMIVGKDFKVFKGIPRWEMLVVDEGQRLKNDASLMWANLQKLNSIHRVLLTGTPLNNNIRELFNLLNFLAPDQFTDRAELEKRFEQDNLNEELVRELHALAQPFILRRIKDDVLRLPPKVEIIVPISLTRTQVDVYKLLLEQNIEKLQFAMAERKKKEAARAKRQAAKIEGGGLIEGPPKDEEAAMNGETAAPAGEAGLVGEPTEEGQSALNGVQQDVLVAEASEANGPVGEDVDMGEGAEPSAAIEAREAPEEVGGGDLQMDI